jgi:hypothetical protein
MFPQLTAEQIEYVTSKIKSFYFWIRNLTLKHSTLKNSSTAALICLFTQ